LGRHPAASMNFEEMNVKKQNVEDKTGSFGKIFID
jgi:hypothetical protein